MSNAKRAAELDAAAKQLKGAASALRHGRIRTAQCKIARVVELLGKGILELKW